MIDKDNLRQILQIDKKQQRIRDIEAEMAMPDFWSDRENVALITQELSSLIAIVRKFDEAQTEEEIKELEKEAIFCEQYDDKTAILSIHAGAGGTEAQDWAEMLQRMYLRFAEKKNWRTEILSQTKGEEAGIKSATLEIKGHNAFGHLKTEAGVHRLVRISPYDADKSRHTSFALVEVIPDLGDVADIDIDDKELRIDVFRASGHGGQSVNTTDSAVRLTHLPTNTVVSIQSERSQLQNKEKALKILKSKLYQMRSKERKQEEAKLRGEHLSAEWGNQIRSYVLQPYRQVKDHRSGCTSNNPTAVLEGDIEEFIISYLKISKE
jgi:peptide chain release factor 2